MSSHYFRIDVYEDSFGCPELDLMGYNDINRLLDDCWGKWLENAKTSPLTKNTEDK